MKCSILSKEYLINNYIEQKKSIPIISKESGCSQGSVYNYMKKYNILSRSLSESHIGSVGSWKGKKNPDHSARMKGQGNPAFGAYKNHSKEKNPMFGKQHTIETKQKISQTKVERKSSAGENNSNYGKYGKESSGWRGGVSLEEYPSEFWRIRPLIRQRDNNICQECGKSKTENNQDMDVHHIDYNKTNNNSINLICLCKVCHGKTNGDKRHWIKHFNRKEIYV